jgi:hypothetical protein
MLKKQILLQIFILSFFSVSAQVEKKPNNILPDHIKLQYAGGIGFIALGAGYESKKGKTEGDFFYGYLPKKIGGVEIHAITGKFTWSPFKIINKGSVQIKPLSLGVLFNYTFGEQYFLFSPDNYPYSYYNYPTALHAGFFIGGQIKKQGMFHKQPFAYCNIKITFHTKKALNFLSMYKKMVHFYTIYITYLYTSLISIYFINPDPCRLKKS